MAEQSILEVLKKAMELAQPDFRQFYRVVRKAKVVATYASDGKYFADVQPLRNDDAPDTNEPVIPRVEIPIFWGGAKRGIVCPPATGTLCDLSYYDGDPNYPRISNFRWQGNMAPECGIDELIIQQQPGVSIKIEKDGSFLTISPKDWTVKVSGNATIEASGTLTLKAPNIMKQGNESCSGHGGGGSIGTTTEYANRTTHGSLVVDGPISCSSLHVSGNAHAGSRSGGSCPH